MRWTPVAAPAHMQRVSQCCLVTHYLDGGWQEGGRRNCVQVSVGIVPETNRKGVQCFEHWLPFHNATYCSLSQFQPCLCVWVPYFILQASIKKHKWISKLEHLCLVFTFRDFTFSWLFAYIWHWTWIELTKLKSVLRENVGCEKEEVEFKKMCS